MQLHQKISTESGAKSVKQSKTAAKASANNYYGHITALAG